MHFKATKTACVKSGFDRCWPNQNHEDWTGIVEVTRLSLPKPKSALIKSVIEENIGGLIKEIWLFSAPIFSSTSDQFRFAWFLRRHKFFIDWPGNVTFRSMAVKTFNLWRIAFMAYQLWTVSRDLSRGIRSVRWCWSTPLEESARITREVFGIITDWRRIYLIKTIGSFKDGKSLQWRSKASVWNMIHRERESERESGISPITDSPMTRLWVWTWNFLQAVRVLIWIDHLVSR